MERPEYCPRCGYHEFGCMWQRGRKLAYRCSECHWTCEHFTPPQQEIETEQKVYVDQFCGITYTIYDEYGHVMTMSRTYDDRDEAIAELKEGLKHRPGSTAVLWPEFVIAKGEVFK